MPGEVTVESLGLFQFQETTCSTHVASKRQPRRVGRAASSRRELILAAIGRTFA